MTTQDKLAAALLDLAAYVGCWTHSTDKGRQEVSFLPTDPRGLLCERAKEALALHAAEKEATTIEQLHTGDYT